MEQATDSGAEGARDSTQPDAQVAPVAEPKRERAPLSAEQIQQKATAAATRKHLRKLQRAKSPEELFALAEELQGKPVKQKVAEATAAPAPTVTLAPGQLDPREVASAEAELVGVFGAAITALPLRYRPEVRTMRALDRDASGSVTVREQQVAPEELLAKAFAPLVTQNLGAMAKLEPWQQAAIGGTMVLGPSLFLALRDLSAYLWARYQASKADAAPTAEAKP